MSPWVNKVTSWLKEQFLSLHDVTDLLADFDVLKTCIYCFAQDLKNNKEGLVLLWLNDDLSTTILWSTRGILNKWTGVKMKNCCFCIVRHCIQKCGEVIWCLVKSISLCRCHRSQQSKQNIPNCTEGPEKTTRAPPGTICGIYRCADVEGSYPPPQVSTVGYINGVISGVHLRGI